MRKAYIINKENKVSKFPIPYYKIKELITTPSFVFKGLCPDLANVESKDFLMRRTNTGCVDTDLIRYLIRGIAPS